ncbi:monovalent cation:H+ antiporter, CPA1 family [Catalinimonas alkaloidigena]|uniref:Monovalent cation:H+ antiporter, CPA1 family n=1 Tax=Catalinimonas alkaloidigena TaxID=1075417 RepID=A0A1G9ACG0_9BACT|nr:sodium:proton antiporter [Catalinimonas alkaloidigena]SDK25049.1 monovalent cation:H+ antiporter, CPA1 family [Catalinimonas alkaloidigena]
MDYFQAFGILISLSAAFGYINHRFLRLPTTIGLMLIALFLSLLLIVLGIFDPELVQPISRALSEIDFSQVLMEVMLSFLLFAGALHVDVTALHQQRWPVLIFATLGVVASTFMVGTGFYFLLQWVGFPIDYIYCLLFGSLISPTDPIAVLSILHKAHVPKELEVKITGESLFNDGVAVVVFLTLLEIAQLGAGEVGAGEIATLFAQEALGGGLFGLALGYGGYLLLKSIDAYVVEVLITLAMVTGGYLLAQQLHLSGPLAVVVMGLVMSQQGRKFAMSDETRDYVDLFWEMIDEVLNAVLFVLIGLEVLVLEFHREYFLIGAAAIVIVLLARLISVGLPISLMSLRRDFVPYTITILTWGGLRGGISVALALSLPGDMPRELIVAVTYLVVIFSIVVQGLSIEPLVRRLKVGTG